MLAIKNNHHLDNPHPFIRSSSGSSIPLISVLDIVDRFLPPIKRKELLDKLAKKTDEVGSIHYGKTTDEIEEYLEEDHEERTYNGTKLHEAISNSYNGFETKSDYTDSTEYSQFLRFKKHCTLTPYRTEWAIYDPTLRIIGNLDMAFTHDTKSPDNLVLYEWKTVKYMQKYSNDSYGVELASTIPNNPFWRWTLQLNIYRAILEKNYGKKVSELRVLILQKATNKYIDIKVPMLDNIIFYIWRWRKAQILGVPYRHIHYDPTYKFSKHHGKSNKCMIEDE
jgi:hypothetical protein